MLQPARPALPPPVIPRPLTDRFLQQRIDTYFSETESETGNSENNESSAQSEDHSIVSDSGQLSIGDDNDPAEPILQQNQQSRQSIHKDTKEGVCSISGEGWKINFQIPNLEYSINVREDHYTNLVKVYEAYDVECPHGVKEN